MSYKLIRGEPALQIYFLPKPARASRRASRRHDWVSD